MEHTWRRKMADFRTIPGETDVHYVDSTFVVSRLNLADIALWGGGPHGEDLVVAPLNPNLFEVYDVTHVTEPIGDNLRRIRLTAKDYGQTTLQARLGPNGPSWAEAAIAVEGTVIANGYMTPASDAPITGSIPVAIGAASVVRIPVPGTNGLAIELTPRGWTPKGGSTSTLFIQDIVGKRQLASTMDTTLRPRLLIFNGIRKGHLTSSGFLNNPRWGKEGKPF